MILENYRMPQVLEPGCFVSLLIWAGRPVFIKPSTLCILLIWIDLELSIGYSDHMTKEQLIEIIEKLLKTDTELDFLSKLSRSELKTLVAAVRNRVENYGESWHRLIMLYACNSCFKPRWKSFLITEQIFNYNRLHPTTTDCICKKYPNLIIS